jgi:hypothetical protein
MTGANAFFTPKQVLLVSYDLKAVPWNYTPFYEALKQQGAWWHYISSTWIIVTQKSSDQVYAALAPHLSRQDFILVVPVKKPAHGWLPKAAWDWINENLSS